MTKVFIAIAILALCATCPLTSSYAARDKSGVLKASNLIGAKVQDIEGKKLGTIKDLVIDPLEGDIGYAVLDFGGFLGLGDKYFAVPWDAFKLGENQKYLILDVSKKVLKNAPDFLKISGLICRMGNGSSPCTIFMTCRFRKREGLHRTSQKRSKTQLN